MVAMACAAALLDVMSISAVTVTVPHIPRREQAVLAAARDAMDILANAVREVTCANAALDVKGTRTVQAAVSSTRAKATPNAVALPLTLPTTRKGN